MLNIENNPVSNANPIVKAKNMTAVSHKPALKNSFSYFADAFDCFMMIVSDVFAVVVLCDAFTCSLFSLVFAVDSGKLPNLRHYTLKLAAFSLLTTTLETFVEAVVMAEKIK